LHGFVIIGCGADAVLLVLVVPGFGFYRLDYLIEADWFVDVGSVNPGSD